MPRGEYCCIVLVPRYEYSRKSVTLVTEIAKKVTREGYEGPVSKKIYEYLAKPLVLSRTTITVSEVLEHLVEEEYVYQDTVDTAFGENSEFLQMTFD